MPDSDREIFDQITSGLADAEPTFEHQFAQELTVALAGVKTELARINLLVANQPNQQALFTQYPDDLMSRRVLVTNVRNIFGDVNRRVIVNDHEQDIFSHTETLVIADYVVSAKTGAVGFAASATTRTVRQAWPHPPGTGPILQINNRKSDERSILTRFQGEGYRAPSPSWLWRVKRATEKGTAHLKNVNDLSGILRPLSAANLDDDVRIA